MNEMKEEMVRASGITDEQIGELGALLRTAINEQTDEYLWLLFMYLAPLVMNPKAVRFTGSLYQECFKNVCQLIDNLLTTTENGQKFIDRDTEIKDGITLRNKIVSPDEASH
jgi:hypothetical protein